MGFHDVVLDTKFTGYGSVIGPGHKTAVPETQTGLEDTRFVRWAQNRRRFEIANNLGVADAQELTEHLIARHGPLHSFLLQDQSDFSSNANHFGSTSNVDQNIGTGNGSQTEFQLQKLYGTGSNKKTRIISKPVPGTAVVAVDGVGQLLGTDYAIDDQSGRISFIIAPANTLAVTAGFMFYCQVAFAPAADSFEMEWEAFDIVNTTGELIEERPAVVAGERNEALTEQIAPGGGQAFVSSVTVQIPADFTSGTFLEIIPFAQIDVRMPDVQENTRWNTFPAITQVAEGSYFALFNGSGTVTITLKERFDPGGGFVWRSLLNGATVAPYSGREIFLDESGIWRAR